MLKPNSTASSQSEATFTPFPATPTKPGGVVIEGSYRLYLPLLHRSTEPTATPPPTPTAPPAPAYTYSRYLTTVDNYPLGDLGRERGGCLNNGTLAPAEGLVVLAFGYPWNDGVLTYGVALYGPLKEKKPIPDVEDGVRSFIADYYHCVANKPNTFLTLAVGLNNSGPDELMDYGHGRAWVQMVNRLNAYIETPPSWAGKIRVVGAMDFEPNFNLPTSARAWADGYASAYSDYPYYNFGTCTGCPLSG